MMGYSLPWPGRVGRWSCCQHRSSVPTCASTCSLSGERLVMAVYYAARAAEECAGWQCSEGVSACGWVWMGESRSGRRVGRRSEETVFTEVSDRGRSRQGVSAGAFVCLAVGRRGGQGQGRGGFDVLPLRLSAGQEEETPESQRRLRTEGGIHACCLCKWPRGRRTYMWCADPSNAQPGEARTQTEGNTRSSARLQPSNYSAKTKGVAFKEALDKTSRDQPAVTLPRGASRCEITGRRVFGMGHCHVGSRKQRPRDCLLPCRHDPRSPPSAPSGVCHSAHCSWRGEREARPGGWPLIHSRTQIHGGNRGNGTGISSSDNQRDHLDS